MERKLVFVYNANTDPISSIVDYAHKIFKPSTYKCELCALTHHHLGERSVWRAFKERANAEMEFMYIRQFETKFNLQYDYPVIIEVVLDEDSSNGVKFVELMGKKDLQKIKSVDSLINDLDLILVEKYELL